jgi:hypothetical protein
VRDDPRLDEVSNRRRGVDRLVRCRRVLLVELRDEDDDEVQRGCLA